MRVHPKGGMEFWLYTLIAYGMNTSDMVKDLINATPRNILEEKEATKVSREKVDLDNLVSSDDKQIKYLAQGYINDEWCEYQILCPTCKSDKISQAGSKNGDIKFMCKNPNCTRKYFYLTPFIHSRVDVIAKTVAIWLVKNNFPFEYIEQVCGVSRKTIYNWVKEYDKL